MGWLRRLVNTVRSGQLQRDIDREIDFHIREREEDLRASGVSVEEARRRARIQFGNPLGQRERTQDVDMAMRLDTAMRNVRHAVRTLIHAPGFSLTVVLTLALGIGANTAVFSAMDTVRLRPLPFRDPDRLVSLTQTTERTGETDAATVRVLDWDRLNTTFQGITGHMMEDVSDTTGDQPERVRRATVLPRFLDVWGVDALIGRGFTDAEHRLGGPAAILISERYWRRRFDADPDVLNKSVRMAGRSYPIVGIRTLALALFAATALALSCLGIYGTLSYIVSLRRREVGLRLALGAARSGIVRQFVAQGLRITAVACACGLALSMAVTVLLSGMLYGVTRFDPGTLSGVVLVVLAVATLASLVPASRAAFVHPMRALREE